MQIHYLLMTLQTVEYNDITLAAEEVTTLQQIDQAFGILPVLTELSAESFGFVYENQHITGLGLPNLHISELPDLSSLIHLRFLSLYNNELSAIPDSVISLHELQYLNLYHNKISFLPAEINSLSKLKYLNLSENKLERLPLEISLLPLEHLDLYSNNLSEIPSNIGKLQQLKYLSLSYNNLTELPRSIGDLQSLKKLHLWGNNLRILPNSMKNLHYLKELKVKANLQIKTPRRLFNALHDVGCTFYWQNAYVDKKRPLEGGTSRFWCPPKV